MDAEPSELDALLKGVEEWSKSTDFESMSLPPLNFTPAEAVAIAVALGHAGQAPFARHARSALRKVISAMPARDEARARELASRVRLSEQADAAAASAEVARAIEDALLHRRVLRIGYQDRKGAITSREIEPGVFLGGLGGFWYLVGWCRLREDVRVFRLDRIDAAEMTGERCPERPPEQFATDLPDVILRNPALD
jgi:predicted DNA-binding transcriptional regulator YafY